MPLQRVARLAWNERKPNRIEFRDVYELQGFTRGTSQAGQVNVPKRLVEIAIQIGDAIQVRLGDGEVQTEVMNEILGFALIAARQQSAPLYKLAVVAFEDLLSPDRRRGRSQLLPVLIHLPLKSGFRRPIYPHT